VQPEHPFAVFQEERTSVSEEASEEEFQFHMPELEWKYHVAMAREPNAVEFDVEHMPGMNHSIMSLEAQHTELMNLDNNAQMLPESSESSSQKQMFI
jgi:uncharacterized protein involved in copper resistance